MNLVDDPIFDPNNSYSILKKDLEFDAYAVVPNCGSFDEYTTSEEVKEYDGFWEKEINSKIKNTFIELTNRLDKNSTFYFGCPLETYKKTYNDRLDQYCHFHNISDENIFSRSEIDFLTDILAKYKALSTTQNINLSNDFEYYKLGFEIIGLFGYDSYFVSHTQKIAYLNEKLSQYEIQKNPTVKEESIGSSSVINTPNPFPHVFTSSKSFSFFMKLINEFKNTKENLANYSFVYHNMLKDNFILQNHIQLNYIDALAAQEIVIDRIKPINKIGKIQYRRSIYESLK